MKKTLQKTIHQFPVIVHEDEISGYWVECPTLHGCYSQGETIDEALQNIREAIALTVEDVPKKQLKQAPSMVSLHFVSV